MTEISVRICKRCLLRDMAEHDSYATLYAYLNSLSADDKVPDTIYEERLAVCRACDKLLSGMCVLCGCYVELRAAMRVRGCPHVPAKWEPYVCCDTERT